MKRVSATAASTPSPSARVVDGTLVLSLPDAITPIVWRLDLGQTKASALEVRGQDNGNHVLVLRTPKGEIHEIAPYETKNGAVRALMAVSQALESGQGQMRAPGAGTIAGANDAGPVQPAAIAAPLARARGGLGKKLLLTVGGIVALIFILSALGHYGPSRVPAGGDMAAGNEPAASSADGAAPSASGVPVSADQFLQGR